MQCHVRLNNLVDRNAEKITKEDKKIAAKINYSNIEFPLNVNDFELIEDRFIMNVNVFGYEDKVYPLYVSEKSHTQILNLLLITHENKSHQVFIKDFNRLMFSKTKHKEKKHQCMSSLQSLTAEELLDSHKKQCLLINGSEAVNYGSGIKEIKNYEKQVRIVFIIYPDTKCFLKRTNSYEGEYKIKYQEHTPNSIGAKLVCIDDRTLLVQNQYVLMIDLLYHLLFSKEMIALINLLNRKKNRLVE